MQLEFSKLNGLGNDFIFIDDPSKSINLTKEQVAFVCDRHFGIGADGVILVRPSNNPDCIAYMHYINADGSLAEMCGNGVRCFAKYLIDRGRVNTDKQCFVVDTMAGPHTIWFETDAEGLMTQATVDMGAPVFESLEIPTALNTNAASDRGIPFVKDSSLDSPWGDFSFTVLSMGNPHAVCFIDNFDDLPNFDLIGAYFESHEAFPEKVNVEFVTAGEDGIKMRVFERGVGETLACGTGACAVSVAACLTDRGGYANDIQLLGGTLHIEWNDDNHVLMTGTATETFSGTIEVKELA